MRPVQIAFRTLEVLGEIQPAGVSELARQLGLPKSTVQRSLAALAEAGWIEPMGPGQSAWILALRALIATGRADFALRSLRTAAIPVMEDLRRKTEESVYLAVLYEGSIALVERLDGIRPVTHAWPLWRSGPLHRTSLGKSILAAMSPAEIESFRRGQPAASPIHSGELVHEIAVATERGFATAFGSNFPDENGVGAAIRDARGAPIAAISISAPRDRMSPEDCLRVGPQVLDAARRISMGVVNNAPSRRTPLEPAETPLKSHRSLLKRMKA